ncbi:exodeoxyribonuclease V subunit alpha [Nakamurella leprariae]|uniref:RecBCD enzyme subunit RecD n=1 Tax=Nakamurella leprariae TaxID=2803911 RepID=A0A938Y772_9ACTN|nr:exodeoxyribonuclease V subunit alpha [Nakamurella leprariae]MBM9467296.1 exodeoxyribonuclease V subunit alpha [Nakamurella leprariae]
MVTAELRSGMGHVPVTPIGPVGGGRGGPVGMPGVAPVPAAAAVVAAIVAGDDERDPTDPWDVAIARNATGVLREANLAGVLTAADVHVADRLGRLGGETDERVLLAAALAVRGVRLGSVCLDLRSPGEVAPQLAWPAADEWPAALRASPLVGSGRPLWLDGTLLYLERYWREEQQVAADLLRREGAAPPVVDAARLDAAIDRLFAPDVPEARAAARSATTRWTTVLGGGPGTGKTTTIGRLLAVLADQPGPPPRIALAAPTGKAATRLQEAVGEVAATPDIGFTDAERAMLRALPASTLHRLLGWRPGSTRFRHDRSNPLPFDVVVVDETSMVSLTLTARLVEALSPRTRLVLVGDPDQLASVEAGSVLPDLVAGLSDPSSASGSARPAPTAAPQTAAPPTAAPQTAAPQTAAPPTPETSQPAAPVAAARGVVLLTRTWRFGGAVAQLATAVRTGDADSTLAILRGGGPEVSFLELEDPTRRAAAADPVLRGDVVRAARAVREAATAGDVPTALERLNDHRVLCAHRSGPFGVTGWSRIIERWLATDLVPAGSGGARTAAGPGTPWYPGRPLLVTENDYSLKLFNGETGVVVRLADGSLRAVFTTGGSADPAADHAADHAAGPAGDAGVAAIGFAPSRLTHVQTMHALTVHRSQGSQYQRVALILPPPESPLLTRELLYTALTRTRDAVRVIGDEATVRAAVQRRAQRATGLAERLRPAAG